MKKFIITGSNGMLGRSIVKLLQDRGEDFIGLPHSELDITHRVKVRDVFSTYMPSIVIHTAAWTDVDGCERNPRKAFLVNEGGTENIAMACKKINARLVYISTDFVFDGKKRLPYTEEDMPGPINVYGNSKLRGEDKVREYLRDYFIVRSSWLFGPGRHNFVTKILSLSKKGEKLKIVEDQIGTPTYTRDLAYAILRLIDGFPGGIYHVANRGCASRYEWAKAILEYMRIEDIEIIPIRHRDFSEVAPRPRFSALESIRVRLGLPHWRDALRDYIEEFERA